MFDDAEIDWTGEMQNLWYYIDPQIGNSTIREDTARNNVLDIYSDDIIEYEFDTGLGKTKVRRYQTNTSAQKGTEDIPSSVELDETKNLREAGHQTVGRDLATSPRTSITTSTA
jgi:type IV pilus assembly protein PilY1